MIDFPAHKASLHLTHNDHLANYRTVAEAIEEEDYGYTHDCWINAEQKQKAIEINECWHLQWYPDTPVGFCSQSAADLDALLKAVKESV